VEEKIRRNKKGQKDIPVETGTGMSHENGLEFDAAKQAYPGQPIPPLNANDEIDAVKEWLMEDLEPWFRRDSEEQGRDAKGCREYLDSLTDTELIDMYYKLRDEKVVWGNGYFYPNIKKLFMTPFEREKDRREIALWEKKYGDSEAVEWYRDAQNRSCVWWIENHLVMKHAYHSCMNCGLCTAVCPAAEFNDYNPRKIMEIVQRKDEDEIIELLKDNTIWFCAQCGSCKTRCPRGNNPFAVISSLRQLSELKGCHTSSIRGRQQYAGRHLWGGNYWNRGWSLYFRNPMVESHLDFGPRFARYFKNKEEIYRRVGGCPDMDGSMPGRKVPPETLHQLRRCFQVGGALFLWDQIENYAREQAKEWDMDIDDYLYNVWHEG
jgi:heterodisulfide reductase subunit C